MFFYLVYVARGVAYLDNHLAGTQNDPSCFIDPIVPCPYLAKKSALSEEVSKKDRQPT